MVYKVHCLLKDSNGIRHVDYMCKLPPLASAKAVVHLVHGGLIKEHKYDVLILYSQNKSGEYFWSKPKLKVPNSQLEALNRALEPYDRCVIYDGHVRLIDNKIPKYEKIKQFLNPDGIVNYAKLLCKGRRS